VEQAVKEKEILTGIKQGDKKALKLLIDLYEKNIANIVIGILGESPEAEEVAQDVFISFYFNSGKFKEESSLKTYLTRIAINKSLNALKKRKRISRQQISNEELRHDAEFQGGKSHDYENREIIDQALYDLGDKQRAVFVLRMIEGYSTKETAKILRIPSGTVLSRLSRAVDYMRSYLEKQGLKY